MDSSPLHSKNKQKQKPHKIFFKLGHTQHYSGKIARRVACAKFFRDFLARACRSLRLDTPYDADDVGVLQLVQN